MGKPYLLELESLAATYEWSLGAAIASPVKGWTRFCSSPLISIGSGGSFSAATLVAQLHEYHTGFPAKALTPLDAALSNLNWGTASALILSARGGNPDILGVFRRLAVAEPKSLGTLCTRLGSPLGDLTRKYTGAESYDIELPTGKDGFLATNSLLATSIVAARLYSESISKLSVLPHKLDDLLCNEQPEMKNGSFEKLWKSDTLIALYSPTTRAAAVDLESKFSEAAISNLQAVDYRNFAHGRHHWLSRHRETTGVIALIADEVEELSVEMLRLIPKQVPTLQVRVHGDMVQAAIAAMVHAIKIVGMAGIAAGFDPGRPHVPAFGRKIYHLNAFRKQGRLLPSNQLAAIVRKSGSTVQALELRAELNCWNRAYTSYCSCLQKARFGGFVLDYDGTLCEEHHRFDPLDKRVAKELIRLARCGTVIGIATGRGKSVREALQNALPKAVWKQFLVGYYNGGDIGDLKDNSCPDGSPVVDAALEAVASAIKSDPFFQDASKLTFRKPQITIEPKKPDSADLIWQYLQDVLYRLRIPGVMALRSSHSMDVVAPSVNKQNVVERVRERLGKGQAILCIGDRGKWPGNDFTLLANSYALSVDEVSPDPKHCWNLAPPGIRGLAATLFYFANLAPSAQGLRIRVNAHQKRVS